MRSRISRIVISCVWLFSVLIAYRIGLEHGRLDGTVVGGIAVPHGLVGAWEQDHPPETHGYATIEVRGDWDFLYSVNGDPRRTSWGHITVAGDALVMHPQLYAVDKRVTNLGSEVRFTLSKSRESITDIRGRTFRRVSSGENDRYPRETW